MSLLTLSNAQGVGITVCVINRLDCKTVVFFANASDGVGPCSNERSGASVKTARENGERR